jgi:hypothetical protein
VDIHTVFIQDIHYLFKRRLANMVDIRHPPSAYIGFIAGVLGFGPGEKEQRAEVEHDEQSLVVQ